LGSAQNVVKTLNAARELVLSFKPGFNRVISGPNDSSNRFAGLHFLKPSKRLRRVPRTTSTQLKPGVNQRTPGSCFLVLTICLPYLFSPVTARSAKLDVAELDRARILKAANQYLREPPVTITSSHSPRSAGGIHDFFSEGDYWWPDPQNPDGPYIQRDGMSNPDNFVEHRRALMRLSVQVPALTAALKLTGERRYAQHAAKHLRAWFVTPATRMNPSLQFAQAIQGRFTGRGIGIIDTIHLVEVARSIEILESTKALSANDLAATRQWFADYLNWMTTSKNGIDERDAKNNHGTCWVMQVAAFAHLTGNQKLLSYCRDRYKTVLLPDQMALDGSFPQELRRTKPYGYSLFNLEAMAMVCELLGTAQENLWTFELADGRGMRRAMQYLAPFIKNKKSWPSKPDVMYDAEWPMRQNSLLFGGLALKNEEYLKLWATLPADSQVEEVIRNFFVRQPVLWVTRKQ
jgi:Alginate lyase